jgi:phosphinothricin acetyltransferase
MAGGNATFETEVPTFAAWDGAHDPALRLVALEAGEVVGFAALAPVSARAVYAGVAESSVYVAAAGRGRGVGRALMEELIRRSERAGIWTIQTGIFPRTPRASRCTSGSGSGSSACASGSAAARGSGATSSCSSAAAAPSPEHVPGGRPVRGGRPGGASVDSARDEPGALHRGARAG